MRYSKTKNESKQKKRNLKKTDPLSLIIAEYGGEEIFDEDNYSRLNKALMALDDSYGQAKDWLLIANMKHIPQKMYSVRNSTQREKQQTAEECRDILSALILDKKTSEEIIIYITSILNINVAVEQKIEIEKIIDSFEYGDYEYKTCQIDDKIWFAENCNFSENPILLKRRKNDRKAFPTLTFLETIASALNGNIIGQSVDNNKFGRSYKWNEANMYIPSGWRLPTVEDYQDLIAHIKSLDYDAGTVLKSTNQWHGSAEKGLDLFGFCAYPTTRNSETGASQTWFWTSSETHNEEHSHYCVGLNANSNDVIISSAGDGYYACVRYVKDVE